MYPKTSPGDRRTGKTEQLGAENARYVCVTWSSESVRATREDHNADWRRSMCPTPVTLEPGPSALRWLQTTMRIGPGDVY